MNLHNRNAAVTTGCQDVLIRGPELIASLPWYDLPEVRSATDGFWCVLASYMEREGIADVPRSVDRTTPLSLQWRDQRLLLTQCCGFNVVCDFSRSLQLVATPSFLAPGCTPGRYRSVIILREDALISRLEDLRGKVCAINSISSHSGANSMRRMIEPLRADGRFFGGIRVTGAHVNSIRAVRSGAADVAAIDCVTLELIRRHRPAMLNGIVKFGYTPEAPAPPYVTCKSADYDLVRRLQAALESTFADRTVESAREALLLSGIQLVPFSVYAAMPLRAASAASLSRDGHGPEEDRAS